MISTCWDGGLLFMCVSGGEGPVCVGGFSGFLISFILSLIGMVLKGGYFLEVEGIIYYSHPYLWCY